MGLDYIKSIKLSQLFIGLLFLIEKYLSIVLLLSNPPFHVSSDHSTLLSYQNKTPNHLLIGGKEEFSQVNIYI